MALTDRANFARIPVNSLGKWGRGAYTRDLTKGPTVVRPVKGVSR